MEVELMNFIVRFELSHIPKGDGIFHGWLRTYFNRRRRHDLSVGGITKEQTLKWCIDEIQKDNPEFMPEYDIEFFKMDALAERFAQKQL